MLVGKYFLLKGFFFSPCGIIKLMSFSILYPILQSFFLYVTHGVLPISPRPSQPFSNCLYVGIYALFVSCLFPPPLLFIYPNAQAK